MALTAGESFQGGFVRNASGLLVVVTSTAGAAWWDGFLRDPDGRLVVKYG